MYPAISINYLINKINIDSFHLIKLVWRSFDAKKTKLLIKIR